MTLSVPTYLPYLIIPLNLPLSPHLLKPTALIFQPGKPTRLPPFSVTICLPQPSFYCKNRNFTSALNLHPFIPTASALIVHPPPNPPSMPLLPSPNTYPSALISIPLKLPLCPCFSSPIIWTCLPSFFPIKTLSL